MMIGVCAHLMVTWVTKQNDDGTTSGWWECTSGCRTRFVTENVLHAAEHEAKVLRGEVKVWRGNFREMVRTKAGAVRWKNRFKRERDAIRAELHDQWLANHDEHCTNMNDCGSFVMGRECYCPRPAVIAYQNPVSAGQE